MATLVALAGAAAGSLVGLPNLGYLAGSIVGNIFFPTGQDTVGPRLQDLSVQSSAYGVSIPWGAGTVRVAGNIIWAQPISEHENVESIGGKGGALGGPTSTTFSYTDSFAVAFAEGPAMDCTKMWADQKLIYNKTANGNHQMEGLRFRFYKGNHTQLPDPLIASDPRIGAGRCPAWRGLVYIVFENLPLEKFGNHVPNITIELAFTAVAQTNYIHSTELSGPLVATTQGTLGIDWQRRRFYVPRGNAATGIGVYDVDTMVEQRQALRAEFGHPGSEADLDPYWYMTVSPTGFIYGTGGPSNTSPIICLDPESLRETGRFGHNGIFLLGILTPGSGDPRINLPTAYGFASNYDPVSGARQDYLIASQFGGGQLGIFRERSVEYVGLITIPAGDFRSIFGRRAGKGLGDVYACSTSGQILRVSIASNARYELPAGPIPEQQFGITFSQVAQITPADIDPTATAFNDRVFWAGYDPSDDSIIGSAQMNDGTAGSFIFKWREGAGLVWITRVNGRFLEVNNSTRISDGRFVYQATSTAYLVDTVTGDVRELAMTTLTASNGTQAYDAESDSIVMFDANAGGGHVWAREFFNRGSGLGTTVGAVVKQICAKVNLLEADLDTTAVDDIELDGYIIGRPVTAKDALLPLNQAFFFDGCESDGKLKFVLRNGAPAFTVPERELAIADPTNGRPVKERRTPDLELPQSATAIFIDKTKDYQQNSKTRQRPRLPMPTMSASGALSAQLPIVMVPNAAIQIADKALYAAWLERSLFQMIWSWTYLWADPTDIATVQLEDATSFVCRANKIGVGLDFSMPVEAISQDAIAYTSSASAGYQQSIPQVVKRAGFTELMVLDVPLLRDIDDTGGSASVIYIAASSFNNSAWPGCSVLRAPTPAATGDQVLIETSAATWGSCATALPDNLAPWVWDTETVLRVYLANQGARELTSSTDDAVYEGANAAVVVRSDGYGEVIQFVNAELEDDGSYSLSRLLRGRRGTDVFCGDHKIGDRFILLGEPEVKTLAVPTADAGVARYWRGVAFGTLAEDAAVVAKATNALDLRPYMPTAITAASTGGGSPDIDLAWVRRARIGNGWLDGAGEIPLAEAAEQYDLEIYDGPGGAIVRTVSALSSPAYTYANADIVSDLGSVPAVLTIRLYQISAVVGRGLTRELTVGVV